MIAQLEQQEKLQNSSAEGFGDGIDSQDVIENRENIKEMKDEIKELSQ